MASLCVSLTLLVALRSASPPPPPRSPSAGRSLSRCPPPCRALDTRLTGTPLQANVPRTIPIGGVCGVPTTAAGATLNFTVTQPQAPGHMAAWPSGPLPPTAAVNFGAGEDVGNAIDIGLGAGGTVIVQSIVNTHLVVDVYGYFTDVEELGNGNTALGDHALFSNTTGRDNTATGVRALESNTTGSFHTAMGFEALLSNTTGVQNTATGSFALSNNTTGSFNTATGPAALFNNTTGNANIATGHSALRFNTTGNENTATGVNALFFNTTGNNNTASGLDALSNNITGSDNTAIGHLADVALTNLTNATAIGAGAVVDASNKVRIGNTSVTVIEGQVAFTFTSDKNQKEHFKPVDGEEVLDKIRQIPVQSWNYIRHNPNDFRHYGPVAQDFFAAFGHDGIGTIGTPTTINTGDMAGILMAAIQGLEKRSAELKEKEGKIAELEARLKTLERLMHDRPHVPASTDPALSKIEGAVQ